MREQRREGEEAAVFWPALRLGEACQEEGWCPSGMSL